MKTLGQQLIRDNRGLTLMETMIVSMVLSLTMLGTLAIFMGSIDYWSAGVSASAADANAGLAVQKLVRDIEEGSSATVQSGDLVVSFPTYDESTDCYNRDATAVTATYYRSGANGTETSGVRENLWKRVGGSKTLLMRGVSDVNFSVVGGKNVTITLTGVGKEGSPEKTSTVTTKVQLRN